MICIFQHKTKGSIFPKPSNSKIKPIFGIVIVRYICIALDLNSEGIIGCDSSCTEITSGEAAIDDDVVIKIDVVSIGMPESLFLLR